MKSSRVCRSCDDLAITFRAGDADGIELRLVPLDDAGSPFPAAGLNLLAAVQGNLAASPTFAIMADWEVARDGDPVAFEASRLALFEQRVVAIPGFFADFLFRHEDEPRRYTVLGLYRERDDLELARGHPAIQAWAQANPVTGFGARDLYGVAQYKIESWDPGWMPD
jgi:hypothetical protein